MLNKCLSERFLTLYMDTFTETQYILQPTRFIDLTKPDIKKRIHIMTHTHTYRTSFGFVCVCVCALNATVVNRFSTMYIATWGKRNMRYESLAMRVCA